MTKSGKPTKISEVLELAIKKIQKGWIQQDEAENEEGYTTSPEAPDAVQFCAVGAIKAVANNQFGRRTQKFLDNQVPEQDIVKFNDADSTTKRKILNVFRKSLNLAKSLGK